MEPDSDYYLRRAETELTMAQAADHPAAVRAHYFLAGFYLDRVHGPVSDDALPGEQPMEASIAPLDS